MDSVWVAVFSRASANEGEVIEDVRVFSSRSRGERFIAAWLRAEPHGRIGRTGDHWISDASASEVREDSDSAVTRYAFLERRRLNA